MESFVFYQKVDLLNGLYLEQKTEASKDICNAILADVVAMYEVPNLQSDSGVEIS